MSSYLRAAETIRGDLESRARSEMDSFIASLRNLQFSKVCAVRSGQTNKMGSKVIPEQNGP